MSNCIIEISNKVLRLNVQVKMKGVYDCCDTSFHIIARRGIFLFSYVNGNTDNWFSEFSLKLI